MEAGDFPLPEVQEALKPYIKPRNEVAAVRRDLHGYLQSQLSDGSQTLASTNLHYQNVSDDLRDAPKALSGVRKAYWKALQAHATARMKYESLKAELEQARVGSSINEESKSETTTNSNHIPLLREREKHRKLQILDSAIADISSNGKGAASRKLEDVIEQESANLPMPPVADGSNDTDETDVETKIMELKKAVLSAKQGIDSQKSIMLEATPNGSDIPNHKAVSSGLRKALDELSAWVERQLINVAEAEAANQEASETEPERDPNFEETISLSEIQYLYDQYIIARRRLIKTINKPAELKADTTSLSTPAKPDNRELSNAPNVSELLLPHITSLTFAKQQEQALVQQSAYVRRQISNAEAETDRTIARLADESHIVHPGATRGNDWTVAGIEADRQTSEYVRRRCEDGETAAVSGKQMLLDIENVPRIFNKLSIGE